MAHGKPIRRYEVFPFNLEGITNQAETADESTLKILPGAIMIF